MSKRCGKIFGDDSKKKKGKITYVNPKYMGMYYYIHGNSNVVITDVLILRKYDNVKTLERSRTLLVLSKSQVI